MLTSKKIAALRPREKRYVVTDVRGLTLRVHPSGNKSWCVRLCAYGRVTDRVIGQWPDVPIKEARQAARRMLKDAGLEPPAGYTFGDAFRLWVGLKKGRIVSYADERRILENHLLPHVRNRQLDEISAPMIVQVLRPLDAAGKRVTLKRVLMRTREIFDLAVCAGYIRHNPIERLSRIFAPPVVTPMPAVDWRELPDVLSIMREAPERIRILFALNLLTMLRPGEAVKLRRSWIVGDVLTIPADEMKKGRAHRVPLTAEVMALIEAARAAFPHPRSDLIFPSRTAGRPISPQTLAKHLHGTALRGRLVAHGLRTIARSWLADMGEMFEAAEACLSHVAGSGVSRAYQRSDYLEARRGMMRRWSAYVRDCAQSARFMPEIFGTSEPITTRTAH